ncbi:MAG: transporter substrate-binding domain-containing protein [Rhodospirillales bacterium]|nr:transporter substrate-binding domain-containing protein [Acetobacter sp.]
MRGTPLNVCFALILGIGLPPGMAGQAALQLPPKQAAFPPALPALLHPTLDRIASNQGVNCGVVKEEEDYSRSTDHGNRAAFDIDLCKAVAVAVLGPGARLVVRSFPDEPFALRALKSGTVDLVATASLSVSNMAQDIGFSAPVLLDGQGMLVAKASTAKTPEDLAGKRVCFLTGSAAEEGLHSFAELHGISYVWYPFSEAGEMEAAFFTGNCDAVTGDLTQLANIRSIDVRRAGELELLPQTLREDPLGIATWAGDRTMQRLVYWTVALLLQAEELGVTQANAHAMTASQQPAVRELLGQGPGVATALRARPHWGAEVIEAVGNYGEVFERDLGSQSKLQLPRGKNRPGSQGGWLYAVPVRDR